MDVVFDDLIEEGDTIAVGDIHGRFDLFEKFLDHVRDSGANVILLGDLIDRDPDDVSVVRKAHELSEDPGKWGLEGFTVIRGNHEQMFLNAVDQEATPFLLWCQNGGNFSMFTELLEHAEWMAELPIFVRVGDTLFVHAGVFPGHDPIETIHDNRADLLMWMRQPFLTLGPKLGAWTTTIKRVVHGHTCFLDDERLGTVDVSKKGDRIGIDTGAFFSGVLTSFNSTKTTFTQFK